MKCLQRVLQAVPLFLLSLPLMAAPPELEPGPVVCRDNCYPHVADFTGDGLDDFIANGKLYVNVRGAFAEPIALTGVSSTDVIRVTGDFTNDGRTDLIVFEPGVQTIAPGQVTTSPAGPQRLMVNHGNGVFVQKQGVGFGHAWEAHDFDGDGSLDVLGGENVDNRVRYVIWLGNGDATFRRGQTLAWRNMESGTRDVVVEDFNGDDRADIALSTSEYVSFFLTRGDGTFAAPVARYIGKDTEFPMIGGDVNGDGNADIITRAYTGASGAVMVLYGDGAGRFPDAATVDIQLPAEPGMPYRQPAYITNMVAAPLYGAADQIVVAFQDGTIVTVAASSTGHLRELGRTKVEWKNTYVSAGRFLDPNDIDLLANGYERNLANAGRVQLVYAKGQLGVTQASTTSRGRGRAIGRAVNRGRSGLYEVRWSGPCAPAPMEIEIQQEGIFVNVMNAGGANELEMAIPSPELVSVRFVVDAGGVRELEGFLVPDGNRLIGRIADQARPYPQACDGSVPVFAVEITPKRF